VLRCCMRPPTATTTTTATTTATTTTTPTPPPPPPPLPSSADRGIDGEGDDDDEEEEEEDQDEDDLDKTLPLPEDAQAEIDDAARRRETCAGLESHHRILSSLLFTDVPYHRSRRSRRRRSSSAAAAAAAKHSNVSALAASRLAGKQVCADNQSTVSRNGSAERAVVEFIWARVQPPTPPRQTRRAPPHSRSRMAVSPHSHCPPATRVPRPR